MTFNWQDLTALSLVLLAVVYLGRQGWGVLIRKKSGGCGSCGSGGCGNSASSELGLKEKPLVTIESLIESSPSQRSGGQGASTTLT